MFSGYKETEEKTGFIYSNAYTEIYNKTAPLQRKVTRKFCNI